MEQMMSRVYPHASVYLAKRKDGIYEYITEIEKERREKIKNGIQNSLKKIGRPKIIDDETMIKAYGK